MRKLAIFILILFNTLVATAQLKLSGTLGPYAHNNVCNKYTNINWEVSYKFEKRTDGIYLTYYNQKITVAQNSLYATAEKNYSKSELGLSVWPDSYSPASLNVSVNCRLPNGKVELSGFACSTSDPYNPNERRIFATTLNGQEVSLSAFTLSVTKASYSPQSVQELDNIIHQRKGQNMTSGSTSASNISTQNPLSTTPITTTRATTQDTQRQAYDQAQAAKAAKAELTAQIVTQAGSLVGGLLDDWNANREKRIAAERAAYEQRRSAETALRWKKYEETFIAKYFPLMDKAIAGDEKARMALYFASQNLFCEKYVPQKEKWFETALANNNTDALLQVAKLTAGVPGDANYDFKSALPYIEKAASLGNVDAMIILATYCYYVLKNTERSFHLLQKAAELGSPNAMFNLGMIYKYGSIADYKRTLKYNVVIDEKVALDWFTKSLMPNYEESLYCRSLPYNSDYFYLTASYFNNNSYHEIAKIYEKGKIVPRDKVKAAEFRSQSQTGKRQKFKPE